MGKLIGSKPSTEKNGSREPVVIDTCYHYNGSVICIPAEDISVFDTTAYPKNSLYFIQCQRGTFGQPLHKDAKTDGDFYSPVSIFLAGAPAESGLLKTKGPTEVSMRADRSIATPDIVTCQKTGRQFRRTEAIGHTFSVLSLELSKPMSIFEPID